MGNSILIITGHSGFIGSNFLKFSKILLNFEDIFLVSRNFLFTQNEKKKYHGINKWKTLDIKTRNKKVIVLHLATKYSKLNEFTNFNDIFDANVFFGLNLLKALKLSSSVRFINICSSFQDKKLSNHINYLYTQTKNTFISICSCYSLLENFTFRNVYLYDTFGSNDNRKKLIPEIINSINTKKLFVASNGKQKLFLTDINEVIAGLDYCIKNFDRIQFSSSIHHNESISVTALVKLAYSIKPFNYKIMNGQNNQICFKKGELPNGWEANLKLKKSLKSHFIKCIK